MMALSCSDRRRCASTASCVSRRPTVLCSRAAAASAAARSSRSAASRLPTLMARVSADASPPPSSPLLPAAQLATPTSGSRRNVDYTSE